MHHFNLGDGTIVGMGTVGGLRDTESVHAIIGGTGRYEGASGSYVARQSPLDLGGDGSAHFTFTMNLRSA
jgi:uridine phosphorylase